MRHRSKTRRGSIASLRYRIGSNRTGSLTDRQRMATRRVGGHANRRAVGAARHAVIAGGFCIDVLNTLAVLELLHRAVELGNLAAHIAHLAVGRIQLRTVHRIGAGFGHATCRHVGHCALVVDAPHAHRAHRRGTRIGVHGPVDRRTGGRHRRRRAAVRTQRYRTSLIGRRPRAQRQTVAAGGLGRLAQRHIVDDGRGIVRLVFRIGLARNRTIAQRHGVIAISRRRRPHRTAIGATGLAFFPSRVDLDVLQARDIFRLRLVIGAYPAMMPVADGSTRFIFCTHNADQRC